MSFASPGEVPGSKKPTSSLLGSTIAAAAAPRVVVEQKHTVREVKEPATAATEKIAELTSSKNHAGLTTEPLSAAAPSSSSVAAGTPSSLAAATMPAKSSSPYWPARANSMTLEATQKHYDSLGQTVVGASGPSNTRPDELRAWAMEEGLSEKSRAEAVEERKASKDDAKAKRNKKRQVADKARQAEMKGRMAEEEMQKIRSVQTMAKSKKAFKCKQEAEAKEKAKAIMAARKARTSNADDRRLATTEEKVAKAAKMGAPKKVKEKQAFYKAAEAAQAEKTRADCSARHALAEARRKAAHGDRAAKAADMGQSQPMNLVEKEEARVAQTQCDEAADTKAFEEAKKAALKARHAGATMGPEPSVDTSRAQKTKSAAAPADPIEDYALGDSNALLAAMEEVESEAPEDVEDVGETEQEAVAKIVWGNDKEDRPDYVNFLKGQVELLQLKEGEQIRKVLKLIAFQEWQRQKLAEANAEVLQERRAAEAAKGEVKTSQARIAQLESDLSASLAALEAYTLCASSADMRQGLLVAEANAEVLQERRAVEAAKGEVKTLQARIAQLESDRCAALAASKAERADSKAVLERAINAAEAYKHELQCLVVESSSQQDELLQQLDKENRLTARLRLSTAAVGAAAQTSQILMQHPQHPPC